MNARGPYAKGVAKRQEILDAALTVIASHGYSGATVKEIADAVGLSQNGLLHYFGSKDALFVEVLRRRDEVDAAGYGRPAEVGATRPSEPGPAEEAPPRGLAAVREGYVALVRHNAAVPGLVHLFTQLTADAADPSHPAHGFFAERYAGLRERGARTIADLQQRGEVRADVPPERVATMLFALIDGLQNQWEYDEAVDMAAHLDTFLDLIRPTR